MRPAIGSSTSTTSRRSRTCRRSSTSSSGAARGSNSTASGWTRPLARSSSPAPTSSAPPSQRSRGRRSSRSAAPRGRRRTPTSIRAATSPRSRNWCQTAQRSRLRANSRLHSSASFPNSLSFDDPVATGGLAPRENGVESPLDEVGPGLWQFTVDRNGLPPTMTAYVLRDGEDTILVDPLVAGETEPLLTALDGIVRGRVRILVTTPFHVRGSWLLWQRWRDRHEVTIFGHEYCATRLDDRSAFLPLRGGETLEGGLRAHSIGRPRRAEIPFELPSHRALAFGDSVLEVDGELRVWPRHRDLERRRTGGRPDGQRRQLRPRRDVAALRLGQLRHR